MLENLFSLLENHIRTEDYIDLQFEPAELQGINLLLAIAHIEKLGYKLIQLYFVGPRLYFIVKQTKGFRPTDSNQQTIDVS